MVNELRFAAMNEWLFLLWAFGILSLTWLGFRVFGRLGVVVAIVAFSLLMNFFVLKQFNLWGLALTGGNALYGAVFLGTDLLSEHYGKKVARQAVWLSFFSVLLLVVAGQVLLEFQPNEFDAMQGPLQSIFAITPRIFLGSMLAFLGAQMLDVYLYDWWKKRVPSQLWVRNLGSTLVSQAVDTVIFTAVGLTAWSWLPREGIIPVEIFWEVVIATYIIKVVVALLDTPFLYASRWRLKSIPQ